VGEGWQAGQGLAAAGSQEVFGYAVDGWPVADFGAAFLAALHAQRLSESGDRRAEIWGCAIKAHAVDAACTAASNLTLLAGAAGCAVGSPLEKATRDLRALLYADGIHDSLYRAAGRALTAPTAVPPQRVSACRAAVL
jgi:alkylation response protein AidB-like acyl-CoA dehydrogenase